MSELQLKGISSNMGNKMGQNVKSGADDVCIPWVTVRHKKIGSKQYMDQMGGVVPMNPDLDMGIGSTPVGGTPVHDSTQNTGSDMGHMGRAVSSGAVLDPDIGSTLDKSGIPSHDSLNSDMLNDDSAATSLVFIDSSNDLLRKENEVASHIISVEKEDLVSDNNKMDSHLAFNKQLGLKVDHPAMLPICKDQMERVSSKVYQDVEMSLVEDDDGLTNYDFDADVQKDLSNNDDEEKIEAVNCSFEDEHIDVEEGFNPIASRASSGD